MKVTLLSILVPAYNESECLPSFYEKLCEAVASLTCRIEILLVNDGSTDDTLDCIKKLQQSDSRIVCVDLSRNYGKEAAVSAGIMHIQGDALVILDADLQHPPELIPEMLAGIEQGFDDVYGRSVTKRHETWFKRCA